jgi:hypothetical protein
VARILVSIQMMFDLAVFGLVAKLIFGAVEVALKKNAPAATSVVEGGDAEPA